MTTQSTGWMESGFTDQTLRTRLPTRLRTVLGVGGALGVAAEVLFDGKALGISFPIYVALLGGALMLGMPAGTKRTRAALLALEAFVFASWVAIRASDALTAANLVATALLGALAVSELRNGEVRGRGLLEAALLVPKTALGAFAEVPTVGRACVADLHEHGRLKGALRSMRFAMFAVPTLLVFTVLLASADATFARMIDRLTRAVFDLAMPSAFVFALAAFVFASGLFVYVHPRTCTALVPVRGASRPPLFTPREAVGLLALVNALFGAFVVINLVEVFREATLHGTYSDNARQGFFQLLAVVALSLGLVLALVRSARPSAERVCSFGFQVTATVLCALVFGIVAIAQRRMLLYEGAYGYTELRVYSHATIFLIAAVLGWRILTLWLKPSAFAVGTLVLPLMTLVILNLLDPDAFIARRDLRQKSPDVDYVSSLSDDARPQLVAYLVGQGTCVPAPLFEALRVHDLSERAEGWPSSRVAKHMAHRALEDAAWLRECASPR